MRVFPVPARDVKRVLLDFTLPLEALEGRYRFQLPLLSDLKPVWDFQLTGLVRGGTPPESLVSHSHPRLRTEKRPDGGVRFEFQATHHQPEGDFQLSFLQPSDSPALLRSYLAEPLPGRASSTRWDNSGLDRRSALYFQASLLPTPPARPVADAAIAPADVLLLVDTSFGLRENAALRRVAGQTLRHLESRDRFRVACIDVAARFLDEGWSAANAANVERALDKFREEFFLGGTDLLAGFRQALDSAFDKPDPARRRLVVYVGDGQDTMSTIHSPAGQQELHNLLHHHRAALAALLVASHEPGEELLRTIGSSTGGLVFDLAGDARDQQDYFSWLVAGLPSPQRIVSVEAKGVLADDLYIDTQSWLPGRSLNILGRLPDADEVRLRITTARAGEAPQTRDVQLAVDPRQDDVFVGRLWAQRRLDQLRRQSGTATQASNELRQEIVALSQEWSLLSPHTAFLVLETEQDYVRWNVQRHQRRRYWQPPDRLPQPPLPADWLQLVSRPREQALDAAVQRKQIERAIQDVREALAGGDASRAYRLLQGLKRFPQAAEMEDLDGLARQALAETERQALLESLGLHRALFDPHQQGISPLRPQLMSLFAPKVSPEFLAHHPHATKLLEEIRLPSGDRDLRDLAVTLTQRTGLTVVLEEKALNDAGLDVSKLLDLKAWGRFNLRTYASLALSQHDLTLVEEPDRLAITTVDEAGQRLKTHLYPVSDLLFTERIAAPGELIDTYADRDEAVAQRLRNKLRQPSQLVERRVRLNWLVEQIADALGEGVMLDQESLEDAGLRSDMLVTVDWPGASYENALRWMLQPFDLTCVIDQGALVITTRDQAANRLVTRFHSGLGVVYEYDESASPGRIAGTGLGGSPGGGSRGGFGGGGMSGGGGFGGGFGGSPAVISVSPVEGGPTPQASAPQAGVSQGGEANQPLPAATTWEEVGGPGAIEPFEGRLSLVISQTQEVHQQSVIHSQTVIDQITTLVAPTSWDDVGGPGSLSFFVPTLDFVITATDEVHQEIGGLLGKLRKLPPAFSAKTGLRPARVPKIGPDDLNAVHGQDLVELLTSTVAHTTWNDVGGPGSLNLDVPRLALIVSSTPEVHGQIYSLLTQLRRSRYSTLRSDRPWEATRNGSDAPRLLTAGGVDWAQTALRALPPPRDAELKLLAVRHQPAQWATAWRRRDATSDQETIRVRRHEQRLEWSAGGVQLRTEYDDAVLAYPGLHLMERGSWAEPARRWLDAALPWLPHRTNEELARLFDISPSFANGVQGQKRLQLMPSRFDPAQLRIEAAFEEATGRLLSWEAYRSDRLAARLRLEYAPDKLPEIPRTVIAEDEQGRMLARWERFEADKDTDVPALDTGWEDYLSLVANSSDAADAALRSALELLQDQQWKAAAAALQQGLASRPGQPLLLFLRAGAH